MVVEREPFAALALTLVIDLKAEGGASEERPDGSFSASASEPPLEALIRLGARMVEEMVRRTITLSILRLHPDGTISTAARRCASWIEGMDTLARIDKATSTEDPATPPRFPISPDQIGDSMSAGAVVVLLTDRMDERIVALQRACRSSARECAVVLFSPGDRGRLPGDLADGLRSSHDFTAGSLWLLRPRTETPDAITPASNSKSRDRVDAPGVSVQEPNWMREYDLEPVARR